jgi:SpoVK/Ycf46/Vps4 family AAA+-type ATPase
LYGHPGCGKTSFISALAGKLSLNICMLNLSSGQLDDDELNQKLHEAPKDSIILLEDIDSIFVDRSSVLPNGMKRVSFSGLLNALDGIASQEGRLTFMTTNHIEKLDPALLRPGRCDVKLEFRKASFVQIKNLFARFYPNKSGMAEKLISKIPEYSISMAELQSHFLVNKDQPERSVETIETLLKSKTQIKDIELSEWLKRLGFLKYLPEFQKQKFRTFGEIKHGTIEDLVPTFGEQKRISNMLSGESKTLKNFQIVPVENLKKLFINHFPKQNIEALLQKIFSHSFSYFEVNDFLRKYSNAKEALENIGELVDPLNYESPKVPLKDFLSPLGFEKLYLEGFLKHGIENVSMIGDISDGDLKTLIGVKKRGHRLKILRAIKAI